MPELQTILTYRGDAVCQPNAWRGTGFPTALREGEAFFHRSAEVCHRDVERFMKHSRLSLRRTDALVAAATVSVHQKLESCSS